MSSNLELKLQDILNEKINKIIPENIKKGVKIFDITGTLEQGGASTDAPVKLFETEEQMQADTTAKEGDLAVVYRSEIQNMTADMEVTSITFPETVTLPTAFTGSANCRLRAVDSGVMFDGNCNLNKISFRFDGYSGTGMIRVEYTSTDGITYTRTRFQADSGDLTNPVELPTTCKVEGEWNDNLGYFMQIGGGAFEGLYQSQSIKVKNTYILDNNRIKIAQYDNFNDSQYALMIKHKFSENEISEYTLLTMNRYIYPFIDSNNKLWVYNSNLTTSLEEYSVNAESYSSRSIIAKTSISNGAIVNDITDIGITVDLDSCIPLGNPLYSGDSTDVVKTIDELTKIKDISTIEPEQVYELKYLPASTQFTSKDSNELLPGKIAYGKNGVVTGDGSIYDNLDTMKFLDNIGMPSLYDTIGYYSTGELSKTNTVYSAVPNENSCKYAFPFRYKVSKAGLLEQIYAQTTGTNFYSNNTMITFRNGNCMGAGYMKEDDQYYQYFVTMNESGNLVSIIRVPVHTSYSANFFGTVDDNYLYLFLMYDSPLYAYKFNLDDGTLATSNTITVEGNQKLYTGGYYYFYSNTASDYHSMLSTHTDDYSVFISLNRNATSYITVVDRDLNKVKSASFSNTALYEYTGYPTTIGNLVFWLTSSTSSTKTVTLWKYDIDTNQVTSTTLEGTCSTAWSNDGDIMSYGGYVYVATNSGTYKYDTNLTKIEKCSDKECFLLGNCHFRVTEFIDCENYTCEGLAQKIKVVDGAFTVEKDSMNIWANNTAGAAVPALANSHKLPGLGVMNNTYCASFYKTTTVNYIEGLKHPSVMKVIRPASKSSNYWHVIDTIENQ